jgi:formylglycine-generating enzyme required for sulfatase activity
MVRTPKQARRSRNARPTPLRVFVSSTAKDLKQFRGRVFDALHRLDHHAEAMEWFGAESDAPVDVCTAKAADADILIVIVAHRCGWIPSADEGGDGKRSITWLEVAAAEEAGRQILAYLVKADAPWDGEREQDLLLKVSGDPEKTLQVVSAVEHLKRFKQHLEKHHVRDTFTNPDDLAMKVATAVAKRMPDAERKATNEPGLLHAYLNEVITETSRIDIRGISTSEGAGKDALSYRIEELYTPLRTSEPIRVALDSDVPDHGRISTVNLAGQTDGGGRVELKNLLASYQRLLLIGAPGSGKTTFLRLIASVLARDIRDVGDADHVPGRGVHLGMPQDREAPLPVFVRLAALARRMANGDASIEGDTDAWLGSYLVARYDRETANLLLEYLDDGRCAILLDGLDEVADTALRERLFHLVQAVLRRWSGNLMVLTSRPHGYEAVAGMANVATSTVGEFGTPEIEQFVIRWVRALRPGEETTADQGYRGKLSEALISSTHIRRMARNPVMLTCLCVVHWNERRLPDGKADLATAVHRWLLQSKDEKREERGWNSKFAEECFKALALAMTLHTEGKQVVVDRSWAAEQLAVPFADERSVTNLPRLRRLGIEFLENEMLDSGIVEQAGIGQLRFWHLTFQEHFAGLSLTELGDGVENREPAVDWWPLIAPHLWDRQWTEVLDHFTGCLAKTGRRRLHLLVERILGTAEDGGLVSTARAVGVLGRLLKILELDRYQPPQQLGWEVARERAMAVFTKEGAAQVPVETRIAAADALAEGGDPRFGRPLANQLEILDLPGVMLGKYPVTVGEYRCFIEADGYKEPTWWGGGWRVRESEGWTEPRNWDEALPFESRPVVWISWYEARAYCNWLAEQTGRIVRLPTWREWEAAAKHPEGAFPWGSNQPVADLAAFNSNVPHPTPVGIYPAGAAVGGHLDLAGNVSEWCADIREPGSRPLRGGSWIGPAGSLAQDSRFWSRTQAVDRRATIGFRVLSSSVSAVPHDPW